MHARHRSPGDGVRSNSIGIGLTSGRISPEDSIRGNGIYNSEYRNFNRGFGRGLPKLYPPPPPPPPPPRKGNIIMEAGRLAAEYLVSQGLLPPNSLPGKWQNGNLNGQMGDAHEYRGQSRANPPVHSDGRTSALARLGNVVNDAGFCRRRFPDDFDRIGGKNYMRGKKRMGSFRGHGTDWGRESGRKSRAFPDTVDGEDDFVNGYYGEQQVAVGVGVGAPKVVPDEMDSELDNYDFRGDTGFNAGSSTTRKDLPPETDVDLNKGLGDDTKSLNLEAGEVKDDICDDKMENKETASEEFDEPHCLVEDAPLNKPGSDLLKLCSFVKVPTKARSSLPYKNSKVDDQCPTSDERKSSDIGPERHSKGSMVEATVDVTSIDSLSNQVAPDVSKLPPVKSMDEAENLDSTIAVERERCTGSQSFSDSNSFMHQQESSQDPPGFGRCRSLVRTRDEDSFAQHADTNEGAKRPREWPSPGVSQPDDFFRLQNLREEQSNPQVESLLPDAEMVEAVDHEFRESKADFREEKQLLPSSFKICDLNLTEASEITESPGDLVLDHISICPSTLEAEKESSVDVGLSISNNCDTTGDYDGCLSDDKEVEIIDVKNGSVTEEKAFNTTDQKTETIYSSLESFLNHTENPDDLPDVQDGYGLAISEFLGTDIANCSSVPADIDLQTEMALHNTEGIPVDDDSIYLSLGEIPISFLGVWDQPNQYGKPL